MNAPHFPQIMTLMKAVYRRVGDENVETDLEKRWFSFLLLLGGDLGPVLLQLTRHRYQSCVATMVNNTIVNLLLNANQISLFHERLKT